jgi:hypothetical protein
MRVFFAAMVIAAGSTEPSAGQVDCRLVVRVYDAIGVSAADLEQARLTVASTFHEVGAGVTWRVCPRSAEIPSPDACDDAVGRNDVILRLVAAPPIAPAFVADNVLGYSRLPAVGPAESLVTVFVNRVRDLARRGPVAPGTLLGRVVAHELGHVFLGVGHSAAGLMRARWKLDELWTDSGRWGFTVQERPAIRRAILASSNASGPQAENRSPDPVFPNRAR